MLRGCIRASHPTDPGSSLGSASSKKQFELVNRLVVVESLELVPHTKAFGSKISVIKKYCLGPRKKVTPLEERNLVDPRQARRG